MARLPLVSPLDRVLFLRAQDYIRGQPSELLAALAIYTDERFYSAGSIIREENDPVDRVLMLAEGSVETSYPLTGAAAARSVAAPGMVGLPHHFAKSSMRPAVRALEDTLCLELDTSDLDQILEDHFSLLLQFATRSGQIATQALMSLGSLRPDESGFMPGEQLSTPVELDLVHRLALVRRMPFFRGANLTVLGQLIRFEELVHLPEGEMPWKIGDSVDSMALVLDGSFGLRDAPGDVRAPAGSVLGAWEILGQKARTEEWVAAEPSRIMFVRQDLFTDLLEDHHDFAQSYLSTVSHKQIECWSLLSP